jgi:hypothetical protein
MKRLKTVGEEVTITQADIDALNLPSNEPKQTISSSARTTYEAKGNYSFRLLTFLLRHLL